MATTKTTSSLASDSEEKKKEGREGAHLDKEETGDRFSIPSFRFSRTEELRARACQGHVGSPAVAAR